MNNYINNYYSFNNSIIRNYNIGNCGIGYYIKFFMFILDYCIQIRLYYKKNNIELIHHEM